eukprot:139343_1
MALSTLYCTVLFLSTLMITILAADPPPPTISDTHILTYANEKDTLGQFRTLTHTFEKDDKLSFWHRDSFRTYTFDGGDFEPEGWTEESGLEKFDYEIVNGDLTRAFDGDGLTTAYCAILTRGENHYYLPSKKTLNDLSNGVKYTYTAAHDAYKNVMDDYRWYRGEVYDNSLAERRLKRKIKEGISRVKVERNIVARLRAKRDLIRSRRRQSYY